jgi:hypothetical protein
VDWRKQKNLQVTAQKYVAFCQWTGAGPMLVAFRKKQHRYTASSCLEPLQNYSCLPVFHINFAIGVYSATSYMLDSFYLPTIIKNKKKYFQNITFSYF